MRVVVKFIVICVISLVYGCSSNPVKYYEYYDGKRTKDPFSLGNYCVLEITKEKIIYRANLYKYLEDTKENISYLYMELPKNEDIRFKDFKKLKILLHKNFAVRDAERDIYTMIEVFQGTIKPSNRLWLPAGVSNEEILQFPVYLENRRRYEMLSQQRQTEDYEFENQYLNRVGIWFPSKLKRTRKIDYSLFKVNKDLINKIEKDSVKSDEIDSILTFWIYN